MLTFLLVLLLVAVLFGLGTAFQVAAWALVAVGLLVAGLVVAGRALLRRT